MAKPWFLDLDGKKSGPYQTQEVMSLVAEGEILPHHQISPSLKEGPWISILEWRLNQSQVATGADPAPDIPSITAAEQTATFTEVKIEDPSKPQPWPKELSEPPKPIPAPNVPSPTLSSQPNFKPTISTPPESSPGATSSVTLASPTTPPIPSTPSEPVAPARKEAIAEMFDILQRSKQKREEKQILTAQAQAAHVAATPEYSKPAPASDGSLFKTILMGAGITVMGFWLGQWFQKTSAPPAATVASATSTPPPAPTVTITHSENNGMNAAQAVAPAPTNALVDRSTDKITIRGKVAPTTRPGFAPNPNAPGGQPTGTTEAPPPDAVKANDLKEIQDLKKELLELKNLKEELKNSIRDDSVTDPDENIPEDPNNPNNPPSDVHY